MSDWGKIRCTLLQRANFFYIKCQYIRKKTNNPKGKLEKVMFDSPGTWFPGKEIQMFLKYVKRRMVPLILCSYIFPLFRLVEIKVLLLVLVLCVYVWFLKNLSKSIGK